MSWKALWASRPWAEVLTSVRLEAAEEGLRAAGATKRAAALLIASGYTRPEALLKAAWTAKDAHGRYESAEWRISVQQGCTPAALEEVREFREHLIEQSHR